MNSKIVSIVRRARRDQRGSMTLWVALGLSAFLGMAGMTIDVGRAYVAYNQFQGATNAAALAAAGATYNSTGATVDSQAKLYGSGSGGKNTVGGLANVQTTPSALCLNILMPKGYTCGTGSQPNAVKVVQTATVPTYFLKVLGISSIPLKVTAQAAMQGVAQKWNVAIILDATGSMSTTDSNCGSVTEFQCATNGIKSLLSVTNPCAPGYTSCATSNDNFRVSLFSFPGVSTSTVSYDTTCSGTPTVPDFMVYTLPLENATSYTPLKYNETTKSGTTSWTATYQITDFLSDYYSSGALNTNSALVKAVTGCMNPIAKASTVTGGLSGASSGGGITYYAGALYAAESALLAEQAQNPQSKNAIILLSDGQANLIAATSDFPSEISATLANGFSGYSALGKNGAGVYPDVTDECQQAIKAAQFATDAGTTVYSVAYGSQQSGCSSGSGYTDKTLVATGRNQAFSLASLTPCVTMENIASSLSSFYSDYNQSGSGSTCQDNSHDVVSLQDIFLSIASTFTNPQLLPRNAQ